MSFVTTTRRPWDRSDTEMWLNDWPLPSDFVFRGQIAWPIYQVKNGYGQWLRTAVSYHPALRGLFTLCNEILAGIRIGETMPTPEQMAEKIREWESSQLELPLHADDALPPQPTTGQGVDFARKLRERAAQIAPEKPLY